MKDRLKKWRKIRRININTLTFLLRVHFHLIIRSRWKKKKSRCFTNSEVNESWLNFKQNTGPCIFLLIDCKTEKTEQKRREWKFFTSRLNFKHEQVRVIDSEWKLRNTAKNFHAKRNYIFTVSLHNYLAVHKPVWIKCFVAPRRVLFISWRDSN